ncbi:MAG: ChaN family lipoprotein [Chitinophagales bacterium]
MKKRHFLILTIFLAISSLHFSIKNAYEIFAKTGQKSNYTEMLATAQKADIVLFGELHNNPICHWLQLELTKDLIENSKKQLVLGAEMFEADNQLLIDEYLQSQISENLFEKEMRLWPNYTTDYKPLMNLAKANSLPFIATNIPRRYSSMVFYDGLESLDSLSEAAKKYIAPLPIEVDLSLPNYAAMLEMGEHMNGENFPKAQAVKDATMAHFILKNHTKKQQFIHYNGTYHSNNYEGIVWYLKQKNPKLNILTIASMQQANIEILETEKQMADFVIVVDEDMTKTH